MAPLVPALTTYETVAVAPAASVPTAQVTVPAATPRTRSHRCSCDVARCWPACTSLTLTFVASPTPGVLDDHRVGDRITGAEDHCRPRASSIWRSSGPAAPMKVWTGGELVALTGHREQRLLDDRVAPAPGGTVAVNVSSGDTRTLFEVPVGKDERTARRSPTRSEGQSCRGWGPPRPVHVHS